MIFMPFHCAVFGFKDRIGDSVAVSRVLISCDKAVLRLWKHSIIDMQPFNFNITGIQPPNGVGRDCLQWANIPRDDKGMP
jgi:hypothetical protein